MVRQLMARHTPNDLPEIQIEPVDGADEGRAPVLEAGVHSVRYAPRAAVVIEHLAANAQDLRVEYARRVAPHRGFDRRRQSVVERRVQARAADVVRSLGSAGRLEFPEGSLQVLTTTGAFDRVNHEHSLPARLQLAWSWPSLPVVVAATEFSTSTTVLRLRLRRTTRVRYPLRYYEAAHAALEVVAATILGQCTNSA